MATRIRVFLSREEIWLLIDAAKTASSNARLQRDADVLQAAATRLRAALERRPTDA